MTESSMVERWLAVSREPDSVGSTDEELDAAEAALGMRLPGDYRAMMHQANGGEAEFGKSWVRIWSVELLVETNAYFRANDFAPGLVFFGTDGGGEAYAWDLRPNRRATYIVIPFIVPEDAAIVPCGDTLEEFVATLFGGVSFDRRSGRSPLGHYSN
ncbi:MAG TPA: SMI1/KNR4 family protein [Candidatus Dormibacteraeota bacterium]|nr:SMI1/KNR4 family protein [Candidatus Dormibacteraeota bacterium]